MSKMTITNQQNIKNNYKVRRIKEFLLRMCVCRLKMTKRKQYKSIQIQQETITTLSIFFYFDTRFLRCEVPCGSVVIKRKRKR